MEAAFPFCPVLHTFRFFMNLCVLPRVHISRPPASPATAHETVALEAHTAIPPFLSGVCRYNWEQSTGIGKSVMVAPWFRSSSTHWEFPASPRARTWIISNPPGWCSALTGALSPRKAATAQSVTAREGVKAARGEAAHRRCKRCRRSIRRHPAHSS
jgi:hypothetical protein